MNGITTYYGYYVDKPINRDSYHTNIIINDTSFIEDVIDKKLDSHYYNPQGYDYNNPDKMQERKELAVYEMARDTSNDLEYSSSIFEIDLEKQTFEIKYADIFKVHNKFPWTEPSDEVLKDQTLLGEKSSLPRLKLVSENTGKKGSMYLSEILRGGSFDLFIFRPSIGTLLNKTVAPTLRGWKVKVIV